MTEPMLELQGLAIAFGGVRAVQGVSLVLPKGVLGALIGPNGAGKTTLFALMSGFLRPDTGRVIFKGQDISAKSVVLPAPLGPMSAPSTPLGNTRLTPCTARTPPKAMARPWRPTWRTKWAWVRSSTNPPVN